VRNVHDDNDDTDDHDGDRNQSCGRSPLIVILADWCACVRETRSFLFFSFSEFLVMTRHIRCQFVVA
jgi:hypothetical protein